MTDRDTFAVAALTGLLARGLLQSNLLAADAYKVADAMLRERCRGGGDCPPPDNAPNHDAAPAAIASVDSVAPQPTTRGESDRTDKAAPRPSEGTGDTPKPITGPDPDSRVWETHTPATHATPGEGSEQRECTEPVAWGVDGLGGILATSTSRTDAVDMQSEFAFVTEVVPLYRQAPNFAPPPPDNAAKAPDNAEPVAWAVACDYGDYAVALFSDEASARTEADRRALVGLRSGYVVSPLYRHPPCQDFSQKT